MKCHEWTYSLNFCPSLSVYDDWFALVPTIIPFLVVEIEQKLNILIFIGEISHPIFRLIFLLFVSFVDFVKALVCS